LLPPQHWWIDKDNHFQASAAGPAALYIIEQRGERRPVGEIAGAVLEQIAPLARELGSTAYLAPLRARLDTGPGYARQREIYARSGSLKGVVAFLAGVLEDDLEQRLVDRGR
jgi:carboxylate-amine ligase